MRVAITAMAVRTALGHEPAMVRAAFAQGRSALVEPEDARGGLGIAVAEVELDVRPYLRRRKDLKLLPRAAQLAIPAARDALGDLPGERVGLFLGVGREPPEDATEAAIVASGVDGQLDAERLGRVGLPMYPPLASLRTLPNLVLAHVAIQLGLTGASATCAGRSSAGIAAIVRAAWAVHEGRCEVALAGGADSLTHAALARDEVRQGHDQGVGEAAAILRLESAEHAQRRGAQVLAWLTDARERIGQSPACEIAHWGAVGRCGAADGALAAIVALGRPEVASLDLVDDAGSSAGIRWDLSGETKP